jgi:aminoglycoside 3-N-acetyltransferase I
MWRPTLRHCWLAKARRRSPSCHRFHYHPTSAFTTVLATRNVEAMANDLRVHTERLGRGDVDAARQTFIVMADVFNEAIEPLSDDYLESLLLRGDFWALAAIVDGSIVGGLTAHTLMLTTSMNAELFIYDIAVQPALQRHGIGRQLMDTLRDVAADAGIESMFVAVDNEDDHALDFYRSVGGTPSGVTFFDFDTDD